jgi:branched-chain amino acid transport system ATP-binding protein
MVAPMLQLVDLRIAYGAIEAVKGVSLHVNAGEVVTLIGANGAGKSTLLKGIAGLEPAAGGQVLIDGQDCNACRRTAAWAWAWRCRPKAAGCFPTRPCATTCCWAPMR